MSNVDDFLGFGNGGGGGAPELTLAYMLRKGFVDEAIAEADRRNIFGPMITAAYDVTMSETALTSTAALAEQANKSAIYKDEAAIDELWASEIVRKAYAGEDLKVPPLAGFWDVDSTIRGAYIKPDGTAIYTYNTATDQIEQRTLTTVNGLPVVGAGVSSSGNTVNPGGSETVVFRPDGLRVYMPRTGSTEQVYYADLSVAWDITTCGTFSLHSWGINNVNWRITGVSFSADGSKVLMSVYQNTIIEVTLADIGGDLIGTIGDNYTQIPGFYSSLSGSSGQTYFTSSGQYFWQMTYNSGAEILLYELGTPYDLSTVVRSKSIKAGDFFGNQVNSYNFFVTEDYLVLSSNDIHFFPYPTDDPFSLVPFDTIDVDKRVVVTDHITTTSGWLDISEDGHHLIYTFDTTSQTVAHQFDLKVPNDLSPENVTYVGTVTMSFSAMDATKWTPDGHLYSYRNYGNINSHLLINTRLNKPFDISAGIAYTENRNGNPSGDIGSYFALAFFEEGTKAVYYNDVDGTFKEIGSSSPYFAHPTNTPVQSVAANGIFSNVGQIYALEFSKDGLQLHALISGAYWETADLSVAFDISTLSVNPNIRRYAANARNGIGISGNGRWFFDFYSDGTDQFIRRFPFASKYGASL